MKMQLLAAILMIIFDAIWLSLNKNMYARMVAKIQNGSNMVVRLVPAIAAYIIMYIGMIFVVLPNIKSKSFKDVVRVAGLFGFCVYGIWNATNMAIFENFDWRVALLDTTWGTVMYTAVAYIVVRLAA